MYKEPEQNFRNEAITLDLIRHSNYKTSRRQYFMDINQGSFYMDASVFTVLKVLEIAFKNEDSSDIGCMLQLVAAEDELLDESDKTVIFHRSYHVNMKSKKYISLKDYIEIHNIDIKKYIEYRSPY